MKKIIVSIVAVFFIFAGLSASAIQTVSNNTSQTVVTLSVPGMDCPVCPITVKKALSKVSGVNAVKIDYKVRTATVAFDTSKTNVEQLEAATAKAGYHSKELKASNH